LDDFDSIPDDVVLADLLEPERLDAERPFADLTVPDEETGGEGLPADLGPAIGVDEKAEQVRLPGIQPSAAVHTLGWRLKVAGGLANHVQQVRVKQTRVAHAVNGPDDLILCEHLERLVALGQGLVKDAQGRLPRQAVHGVLAYVGERAELREAPVVHEEGA